MPDFQEAVLVRRSHHTMSIVLNRPEVLNCLNLPMVRLIRQALVEAEQDPLVRLVLFYASGERGFCAGGDIKAMAELVRSGRLDQCLHFLEEEYRMDLAIHRFPKPVVVLADGVTMGGGLGISAGADIVLATERTLSAMPETRIGFFPDVGATGWMFQKCPPGYPEYLGLTGQAMRGSECVRMGFATHLTDSRNISEIIRILEEGWFGDRSPEKSKEIVEIVTLLNPYLQKSIPSSSMEDDWVRGYFAGKRDLKKVVEDLRECSVLQNLCEGVFHRLSERSPTALAVTMRLLRHNEGLPVEEVFRVDLKAARFILAHPDFLEGVRARLIDKDDQPKWNPESIEKVMNLDLKL